MLDPWKFEQGDRQKLTIPELTRNYSVLLKNITKRLPGIDSEQVRIVAHMIMNTCQWCFKGNISCKCNPTVRMPEDYWIKTLAVLREAEPEEGVGPEKNKVTNAIFHIETKTGYK